MGIGAGLRRLGLLVAIIGALSVVFPFSFASQLQQPQQLPQQQQDRQHTWQKSDVFRSSTPEPPVPSQRQPESAAPQVLVADRDDGCRLSHLKGIARGQELTEQAQRYLEENTMFAVITGSMDNFFRADLALCTWAQHVPQDALFFFTDKAELARGRRGTWVEDRLPDGVSFSQQQVESRGYTLSWIKAQFRFLFGIDHIIRRDRALRAGKRWFLLVDDDTFVNLEGLVAKLMEFDARAPRGGAGRYFCDKGWGGAGHIFDRAASETLLNKMRTKCIDEYMVKRFHASDVTLIRCAPQMGLKVLGEATMSHCQATRVREGLLTGRHVTMHIKRDVAKPFHLATWRVGLHYQVVYQRNLTAFKLLMAVGSCAYAGCKHPYCDLQHDVTAMEAFLELSANASTVPTLF